MNHWLCIVTLSLLLQSNGFAQEQPSYRTKNPSNLKTSGVLLFGSREAVKTCFGKVFAAASGQGFNLCERDATAIVQPGSTLEVVQKFDAEKVVQVKILDGKQEGKTGFIHEAWIDPSPWAKR